MLRLYWIKKDINNLNLEKLHNFMISKSKINHSASYHLQTFLIHFLASIFDGYLKFQGIP
jgi:hypothetical protein